MLLELIPGVIDNSTIQRASTLIPQVTSMLQNRVITGFKNLIGTAILLQNGEVEGKKMESSNKHLLLLLILLIMFMCQIPVITEYRNLILMGTSLQNGVPTVIE